MFRKASFTGIIALAIGCILSLSAQESAWNASSLSEERPLFTEDFTKEEFASRRAGVYDQIGEHAIAIVQGSGAPKGYQHFRQNNEFYYLSGIESPDAYLILNGGTREATVYLKNRDERREYGEGKLLSYEDADLIKELSGIEHVGSYDDLMQDVKGFSGASDITMMYTPHSPYEELAITRSMAMRKGRDMEANPLETNQMRYQNFISELGNVAPGTEIMNLDPVIDDLRKIKSPAEIEIITRATRLQGEVIMEAMRSTKPGIKPYQLEAVGKYIYWSNNVQGDAYYALIHFGPDAYKNHYHGSVREGRDGDMILMDYGAADRYYTSDLGRMWPVNGTFNPVQRELYTFYLGIYNAILDNIKIGLTPQEVMQKAVVEMDQVFEGTSFSKDTFRRAAREFIDGYKERAKSPEMGLGHGVGMSVHDVGNLRVPIEPGMVFVIEPQFRVPDELIYVRLEDMIVITEDGPEVISNFLPRDIDSIEKLIAEEGMLQQHPVQIDK
jgi:Xaa-Pro aminopeptidase